MNIEITSGQKYYITDCFFNNSNWEARRHIAYNLITKGEHIVMGYGKSYMQGIEEISSFITLESIGEPPYRTIIKLNREEFFKSEIFKKGLDKRMGDFTALKEHLEQTINEIEQLKAL